MSTEAADNLYRAAVQHDRSRCYTGHGSDLDFTAAIKAYGEEVVESVDASQASRFLVTTRHPDGTAWDHIVEAAWYSLDPERRHAAFYDRELSEPPPRRIIAEFLDVLAVRSTEETG